MKTVGIMNYDYLKLIVLAYTNSRHKIYCKYFIKSLQKRQKKNVDYN